MGSPLVWKHWVYSANAALGILIPAQPLLGHVSELCERKEQLSGCRAPGEFLLMPCLILLVHAAANPLLPQQRQRRGPVRSHDTKKSRWTDQVSVW